MSRKSKETNSREKMEQAVNEYFSANKPVMEIANEMGIDTTLLLFHVNKYKKERGEM